MKKKPKTGILQRFFKIICLAVTLTSAGFLIYHMVYLPMENKKLVAELKGNFPEPEAPGASGSEKKDQPAGRKCPVAAVDLVSLREQYPDVQGWLTIPDTGIDYPVLQQISFPSGRAYWLSGDPGRSRWKRGTDRGGSHCQSYHRLCKCTIPDAEGNRQMRRRRGGCGSLR